MELKDLLNNQGWDKGSLNLKEAFKKKGILALEKLGRHYYQSLVLNAFFLIITIGLFLYFQNLEMLSSSLLIGSCFLFVLLRSYRLVDNYRSIDTSQDISTVIKVTLQLDDEVSRSIRQLTSIILTCSFFGGFFAGLFVSGWNFQKVAEHPIILVIVSILTVMIYLISGSNAINKQKRRLNPGYYKVKSELQTVLEELNKDD